MKSYANFVSGQALIALSVLVINIGFFLVNLANIFLKLNEITH
jgi:hypothetical protein